MSGGAVAALVIGGVVVVGGGVGAVFYLRSRKARLMAPAQSTAGKAGQTFAVPQTPNELAGNVMAAVGPKVATGGGTRTSRTLDTLETYQHGLDNAVGGFAGNVVGKYLGSGAGNLVGGGIKGIAHYANPISVTKDVNKALGKISSKLNPAHWF